MAAKKLRKFPSFMIYLYSKESAFKAVKRKERYVIGVRIQLVYGRYTKRPRLGILISSKGEQDSESFP